MSNHRLGFTLSELLIALAILGVIATFTIPKILQAQGDSSANAKAKEVAGMVSSAFALYKMQNQVTSSTAFNNFSSYMNFVRLETSASYEVDNTPPGASFGCSGAMLYCMILHNGAAIRADSFNGPFGGTSSSHAINFLVDPDGKYGGYKSVQFWLYTDGKIRTRGTIEPNTQTPGGPYGPNPPNDPSWFSW